MPSPLISIKPLSLDLPDTSARKYVIGHVAVGCVRHTLVYNHLKCKNFSRTALSGLTGNRTRKAAQSGRIAEPVAEPVADRTIQPPPTSLGSHPFQLTTHMGLYHHCTTKAGQHPPYYPTIIYTLPSPRWPVHLPKFSGLSGLLQLLPYYYTTTILIVFEIYPLDLPHNNHLTTTAYN